MSFNKQFLAFHLREVAHAGAGSARLVASGGASAVVQFTLKDGQVNMHYGISLVHEEDNFNRAEGRALAKSRMMRARSNRLSNSFGGTIMVSTANGRYQLGDQFRKLLNDAGINTEDGSISFNIVDDGEDNGNAGRTLLPATNRHFIRDVMQLLMARALNQRDVKKFGPAAMQLLFKRSVGTFKGHTGACQYVLKGNEVTVLMPRFIHSNDPYKDIADVLLNSTPAQTAAIIKQIRQMVTD